MRDACVESCLRALKPTQSSPVMTSSSAGAYIETWSTQRSDPFSLCMQQRCAATEPTSYNPEVRLIAQAFIMFCCYTNDRSFFVPHMHSGRCRTTVTLTFVWTLSS